MEKSEVSDTDAPAIRQAIHGSSFRAFLFAVWRGEARGRARREMHAGSNIRLLANNRCRAYATRMSFCGGFRESDMLSRRGGSAEPKYSAHCVHTVRTSRATRRANSRWRNGVKELNRPLKVTSQHRSTDRTLPVHPVRQTNSVRTYFRRPDSIDVMCCPRWKHHQGFIIGSHRPAFLNYPVQVTNCASRMAGKLPLSRDKN